MTNPHYDFVVIHQSCSIQTFELLERLADEIGPTLLFTGTSLRAPRSAALTVRNAPSYDNSSYRSRIRTWLSYTWAALRLGDLLDGKPVILVTSNPPFGPFVGYWHQKRGCPYVIRVLDVYPDAVIQSGLARGALRIVPALWNFANRVSFRRAARVVTLGEGMAERVGRFTSATQTVEIVPEWVDTNYIIPRPKDENWFAEKHEQVGRLTVLYSGNLGLTHDIEGVFQAISELQDEPHIQFLFIGGGARRDEIVERTRSFSNCRVLPSQPEEALPYSLSTADVAIVSLGDSARGVSMPSKTYHMMAAGAAVLGISSGDNDLARTIEKHRIGVNLAPSDTVGIVAALRRLATDQARLTEYRTNARRAAVECFSEQVCAGALLKMLREVHEQKGD
jgi:colanic acid biosynthesis glycosyl transferase WcaI